MSRGTPGHELAKALHRSAEAEIDVAGSRLAVKQVTPALLDDLEAVILGDLDGFFPLLKAGMLAHVPFPLDRFTSRPLWGMMFTRR